MKETDFNEAQESKEENIDVKELLFKYLIHWPWFVGAVVACLIAAWVYLYTSTPVYNISATVLIKDDKNCLLYKTPSPREGILYRMPAVG